MMTSVLTALTFDPRGTAEDQDVHRQAATALLGALLPKDPVQHMFAAHTAAAHFAAMDFFRRAALPDRGDEASGRLVHLANTLVRQVTRSLDRLQRCQAAADQRRPFTTGLAAAIAEAGRHHPMARGTMPGEQMAGAKMAGDRPAPGPAPQAAPLPAPPAAARPPAGQQPAVSLRPPLQAAPQCENARHDPMPSENPMTRETPMPSQPTPHELRPVPATETALPFDRQGWLAAVRAMSPQEQSALANRIRALRGEPPLPVPAAVQVPDTAGCSGSGRG
jgi:hypothetical protein